MYIAEATPFKTREQFQADLAALSAERAGTTTTPFGFETGEESEWLTAMMQGCLQQEQQERPEVLVQMTHNLARAYAHQNRRAQLERVETGCGLSFVNPDHDLNRKAVFEAEVTNAMSAIASQLEAIGAAPNATIFDRLDLSPIDTLEAYRMVFFGTPLEWDHIEEGQL